MKQNNYFIKEDYHPNLIQATYNTDKNEIFWNDNRIHNADTLQYYVYDFCKKLIKKYRFHKVMDVGCGPPVKIRKMFDLQTIELTLIDQPSIEKMVKNIIPVARFIGLNLENIKINLNERFQLIICCDVVEHLIDPDKCISFIKKHLTDNGLAVFSTPERDFRRGIHCSSCTKKEHVREWNRDEFAMYIKSHGFKIKDHTLLPQKRTNPAEYFISRILKKFIKAPKWSSCQVVVCSN
jgi:SAM-dependent methyltransferase